MTVFDQVFLALMVVSVALGVWRGLLSEIFITLGWIVALGLAWQLAPLGAPLMAVAVQTAWLHWPLAFAAIFVVVLVVLAVLRFLLRSLLSISGLSFFDRLAGAGFGFLRGLLLAVLFVAGAGLSDLPQKPWWREAVFAPPLVMAVLAAKPWLPPELAERIRY
ncbi:MAG: CvpA family protein [Candidatus Dactylopiibacterium sp.]|nr:CvpA family protein [Candidatus Dactylopiibacterium sp.]